MKLRKQFMCLVLAAMMLFMALPVCAEESSTPRISDETITLTLVGVDFYADADWNNTVQIQEYEKRLGLKFECTTYNNEQWSTKKTLMFAGDELPDLITCTNAPMSRSEVVRYAQDGYLLNFAPYLDEMPTLKGLMEEYSDLQHALYMDDGGIYAFPKEVNLRDNPGLVQPNYVTGAWLDRLGLAKPRTIDEFYEALKAVKEQDANGNGDPNDEIPLIFSTSINDNLLPILWGFGINTLNRTGYMLRAEDGKVSLWDTSENYKAYLKFMNRLYSEELIDNDCFVIANDEINALGKQDRLFMFPILGYVILDKTNLEKQDEMGWFITPGFTSEYNDECWYILNRRVADTYGLMVNAETEHPHELAKFIDYLYTDEGMISSGNGYEGESFDWLEVVPGFFSVDHTGYWEGSYDSSEMYRQKKATCGAAFKVALTGKGFYDMIDQATDEQLAQGGDVYNQVVMNAWKGEVLRTDGLVLKDQYPLTFYTDDEANEMATLKTDIQNDLLTMWARFISGEANIDSDWDEYLAQLDKMGLPRLLEIEQAAYDRLG